MGLLAIMLLHDSRREARVDSDGTLIILEEQDRNTWIKPQIVEGLAILDRAIKMEGMGPYRVQAAIAAVHAEASSADETDWPQIAALYTMLEKMQPSPVVKLNRAVAVAMHRGLDQGLGMIDQLGESGQLDRYHLFHAARADILRRLGRAKEASAADDRALELTTNESEQTYLRRRREEVGTGSL